NSDFHVVGLNDGLVVADITLLSSVAGSTIDFISLHAGFGNVDLIEFFFDPAGRGVDPRVPDGRYDLLEAIVDNVTFNDPIPAVPEPGAYAMLLAGLGLVGFAANRRSRHYY
ncbi:MAG TPA: PEP-CTERM sorting domain-containing protein, partial [Nitrosomonas sp.]|nr:PEP-CTERM sorting domain-containing protein [Nitrosomonas sp.]